MVDAVMGGRGRDGDVAVKGTERRTLEVEGHIAGHHHNGGDGSNKKNSRPVM